jgi:hypothetical protein
LVARSLADKAAEATKAASVSKTNQSFALVTTGIEALAPKVEATHWSRTMEKGFQELEKLEQSAVGSLTLYSGLLDVDTITAFFSANGADKTVEYMQEKMRQATQDMHEVATGATDSLVELSKTQEEISRIVEEIQDLQKPACNCATSSEDSAQAGTNKLKGAAVFVVIGAGAIAVAVTVAAPPTAAVILPVGIILPEVVQSRVHGNYATENKEQGWSIA